MTIKEIIMNPKTYFEFIWEKYNSSNLNIVFASRRDGKDYGSYIKKFPEFEKVFRQLMKNITTINGYYQLANNDHNTSNKLETNKVLATVYHWKIGDNKNEVYIKFLVQYKSASLKQNYPDSKSSVNIMVLSCHEPETRYTHWKKIKDLFQK